MTTEYYTWGEDVEPDQLTNKNAIAFIRAVKRFDYSSNIRTKKSGTSEGVVFDIETTLPQRPCNEIQETERLCVVFTEDDNKHPEVLALRRDFPSLIHTNLTEPGEPISLCLSARDYREVKHEMTAELLMDIIAVWLQRAAIDELHLPGQRLEPFLLSAPTIISPRSIGGDIPEDAVVLINRINDKPKNIYEIWDPKKASEVPDDIYDKLSLHLLIPVQAQRRVRFIHRIPANLAQLVELFQTVGIELIDLISKSISKILDQEKYKLMTCRWLVILELEKIRPETGESEETELWGFFIEEEIFEVGSKLGIVSKEENNYVRVLRDPSIERIDEIKIIPGKPVLKFDRTLANKMAGVPPDENKILAIGSGSFGSQVIMNLARQGIGKWFLVDEDQLLPHNSARHALSPNYTGGNKADILATEIQALLNDKTSAQALVCDALALDNEHINHHNLQDVDQIFDFSASPAVHAHLDSLSINSSRTCASLTGKGQYLAILSEGNARKLSVSELRIQLAQAVVDKKAPQDLFSNDMESISYAGGCSDITTVLPQDLMAIHAGFAAQFLKSNFEEIEPSIHIWRVNRSEHTLDKISLQTNPTFGCKVNGWMIRLSAATINTMHYHREKNLPNETGGILIGSVDTYRKIVYISSATSSPPDSEQWPELYIRGIAGLARYVENVEDVSAGLLTYVGEWHSHPDGHGTAPSNKDQAALGWLVERIGAKGVPGVIVIAGENNETNFMLDIL